MTIQTRAAVFREQSGRASVENLTIDPPLGREVLVRIAGVGICHSDLAARDGHLPVPFPVVLGHEGAGVIEAVGPEVASVAPGDHVVLSFMSCGQCRSCFAGQPSYCATFSKLNRSGVREDGSCPLHDGHGASVHGFFFGQSSFGVHALAHERNVVRVSKEAPLALLGPLGCGIQTGAGAVMKSFAAPAGSSILVLGGGPVGLAAVLGARIQGCTEIVVSEPHAARQRLALEFGATQVIDPFKGGLADKVRAICPEGVDFALDTTAREPVIAEALACMASRGTLGLVGVPTTAGATITVNMLSLIGRGLKVRGIVEGDADPAEFIPEMIQLHADGRFPFDRMVRFYPLENVEEAMTDQAEGRAVKPVLLTDAAT